jgi:LmbE family N-acetylglucosaminyl deacetylase
MTANPTRAPDRGADPIQRPGTPERLWQRWGGLRKLPTQSLDSVTSAVVLAAHPDDEILGFGGSIAVLAERGARLRIVVATDGEASHPMSTTVSRDRLAELRRTEDANSLAVLGAAGVEVVRLGLPDGGLGLGYGTLAERIRDLVSGFELCVAPWTGDVHPDHEAVGRAALAACEGSGDGTVWQYPVWMWHWAAPGDARVPWDRAVRVEIPAWAWVENQEAVACHRSQILPLSPAPEDAAVLSESDLEHFRRRGEVILR